MPNKIQMKRLWKLVEYMKSLPASANEHFKMHDFIAHSGEGHRHKIPKEPSVKDLHSCGTTACALGWAMTVPSFRRVGLHIHISAGDDWYQVLGSEKVFGLGDSVDDEEDQWDALFGGYHTDRTPKEWARRVRKILRKWEKEAA